MRNLKSFLQSLILITINLFIYSCYKESNSVATEYKNLITETRVADCPEPIMALEIIPGSPCAHVKFTYNGTNDPSTDCILTSYDIKIFKTWNYFDVKNYNSPFLNSGSLTYPNLNNWVGTMGGNYVNLGSEPLSGSFNSPTPITDANGSFSYTIPSTPESGVKTWVCAKIVMNCSGTECPTIKCFDAYTPCL